MLVALVNFSASAGYFIVTFNLPILYRAGMNLSAAQTGLRLISAPVGGLLASLTVGAVIASSARYYWLLMLTTSSLLFGIVLIATENQSSSVLFQCAVLIPAAFGYSGLLTCSLIALLNSIRDEDRATATATSSLCCSLGGIFGIALSNNLLNRLLSSRLAYLGADNVGEILRDMTSIWRNTQLSASDVLEIVKHYVECIQVWSARHKSETTDQASTSLV